MTKKINLAEFYDEMYRNNRESFDQGRPDVVVVPQIVKWIPQNRRGRVIDIGAGQGRNAIYLAEQGFNVTAVDLSAVALKQIEAEARLRELSIKTIHAMAEKEIPLPNIDDTQVLLSTYVLHHIKDKVARNMIEKCKRHAPKGAMHAWVTFTQKGDFFRLWECEGNFFPAPGELKDIYADWRIIFYDDIEGCACREHPNGDPMKNTRAFMLAQKW